jgi:hypothetical protein
MPRHIRSVTARRPRGIAKRPVKDVPRPVPSASAPALALFDGLRRAFQATPDIPESPERSRERYVQAIESLADYLEDIGADAAWIERIDELGEALEDLTMGLLPPLLEPTRAKDRPPSIPGDSSD